MARHRSVASRLPASLILSAREVKQYRRFQAQTTTLPPKDQGYLPTAAQYADFQSWLAKRDSGYLSDTPLADLACYVERASETKDEKGKASACGHALHPSHKAKAERCPVCSVEIHIIYMKVLTVALEDAGGLVKQRWEAVDHESPALKAWYDGKLAFVKEIYRLEALSDQEHVYDQQDHHSNQVNEVKTAAQALDLYWDSMEANPSMMQSPRSKKNRTVVFCPETSFDQGRDQLYFWRKSPRYEAGGKYASSSDSDSDEEDEHDEDAEVSVHGGALAATAVPKHSVSADSDLGEAEASDEEEDEDDSEEEDDDDEDDWEDDDDDEEVDTSYVVFEYEEEVVEGAEFIVFG